MNKLDGIKSAVSITVCFVCYYGRHPVKWDLKGERRGPLYYHSPLCGNLMFDNGVGPTFLERQRRSRRRIRTSSSDRGLDIPGRDKEICILMVKVWIAHSGERRSPIVDMEYEVKYWMVRRVVLLIKFQCLWDSESRVMSTVWRKSIIL